MAEEKKPQNPPAAPSKIRSMDTTGAAIRKDYLKPTADKLGKDGEKDWHAGSVLKMAAIRFAADCANLQGEDRAKFIAQLDATPGWFMGGNPSACRQSFERKGTTEVEKEYTDL